MGFYEEKKFTPFLDYAKSVFAFKIYYIQEKIPFNSFGALFYYKQKILHEKP
jgi:hypothetical protein